jgi:hypothetical protein
MQTMRESWTDERLDDLNAKVDRLDEKVDRLDAKVDRGFEKINDKFDALYRLLLQGMFALVITLFGGFATILAAVIWV